MGIDLTKLSQTELLQLINATPQGTVLTRPRLRRQMDAGALKFGDGTNIHLVRYTRWLVQEVERPKAAKVDYYESRRRKAKRERLATKSAQDIFPIPEIVNYERRKAAGESFLLFCTTYFPGVFWRPWSQDHLRAIEKIEKAVREGGLFAFAMPRGSGKTALARCAALWALLYGYRPFVCMIAGSQVNARELLRPIRTFILEEPLLLEDFPEAIYPLRCLENSSKRQMQQHIQGKLTHVHWGQDKMVFPSIEGEHLPKALRDDGIEVSPSAGSVISTTSLDSNLRGQQHTRPDRSIIRPSLVLLEDPQTRESAMSADQTRKRLNLVHGDVMGLAGPGESISALLTCTVMYEGDLADTLLDREKSPEWDSERTKLVYAWPADQKSWDQYAEIRRAKGKEAATAFYAARREAMDRGASVGWPDRFDAKAGEISAIQHAFNLRLKTGPDGFATEYQNEPALVQTADSALTVDQVIAKTSGHKRGEVPAACTKLTMFVDVHDSLLYFMVCAWAEDFSGQIVEYGTFPQQNRSFFTRNDASQTLAAMFPGRGVDGAIHAGLEKLVTEFLAKEWSRGGGGALMRLDRLLVDSGYKPAVVADVKRRCGGSVMMLSKGVGIRATRRPFAAYTQRPGETIGDHWYMPNVRRTAQFQHVQLDTNFWKSFVHDGLAAAPADRGCIGIYGTAKTDHGLLAEHIARSERWVEVTGPYGTVREWSMLPTRPDNHWLDCLVGCAAAAGMCGIKTTIDTAPTRQRKKYTQDDLRRR
ncbi:MAG: phage terminase large subunit family protein [Phycisphaerae bacterium]|nr:phage terminase large subunit family protein [Phycisphaerae bacterium]